MKKLSGMISVAVVCAIMLFSAAAYANNNGDENHVAAEQAFKAKIVKNIGHGKKVYFAGPMFNAAEKGFNLKVTQVLEEYGYQVFLPQRDGIEAAKLEGKTEEELVKMIFPLDAGEVRKADIVFMNIDGRCRVRSRDEPDDKRMHDQNLQKFRWRQTDRRNKRIFV